MAGLFKIDFKGKSKKQAEEEQGSEFEILNSYAKNSGGSGVTEIPIVHIIPNPNQPRRIFEPKALHALSESIKEYGIIQPLTVRRLTYVSGNSPPVYELVAGERRLRAAAMAGFELVPCVITGIGREESAEVAMIENLQREDLNYFEQAEAIHNLIEMLSYSQEQLAARLSVSQSYIANKLRILKLSPEERDLLISGSLTERHARALIRISDPEQRKKAAETIINRQYNVSETEKYIERLIAPKEPAAPAVQAHRSKMIIRDVRLILNSIERAVTAGSDSGIDVRKEQYDHGDYIEVKLTIPKKK